MGEIRQTGMSQGDLIQYIENLRSISDTGAVIPAALQGGASLGSCQILALSNTAANSTLVYQIDGVLYATAATEVAFTATTHDIAAAHERKFTVAVGAAAAGTLYLYAGAEGETGYSAFSSAVPATQAVIGYVKISTLTTAFTAGASSVSAAAVGTNGLTITYVNCSVDPYMQEWLDSNLVLA